MIRNDERRYFINVEFVCLWQRAVYLVLPPSCKSGTLLVDALSSRISNYKHRSKLDKSRKHPHL